jgi:hypothetical protein
MESITLPLFPNDLSCFKPHLDCLLSFFGSRDAKHTGLVPNEVFVGVKGSVDQKSLLNVNYPFHCT